ncbi:hypothetical protein BKA67DRAFT_328698 [Truncatella angustata]|uniref:Uncharacterized protein n=1 Tax=Truncatella angustata TaxID=152316 RepID=A0A9P8UKJ2_9PEZI|nr:uncharacterized protein BKA67DRAFT_328698 [Truncatella angustata]KAH6653683.1 hypothetical protein BKA67DRAFT_328698 [Truncatella angustata]
MITASQTMQSAPGVTKNSNLWPSYESATSTFDSDIFTTKTREFGYIHYSGHDTGKPPSGSHFNQAGGDLVVTLLSGGEETRQEYLWRHISKSTMAIVTCSVEHMKSSTPRLIGSSAIRLCWRADCCAVSAGRCNVTNRR